MGLLRVTAKSVVHWLCEGRCLGRVRGIVQQDGRRFAAVAVLSAVDGGYFTCARLEECVVECAVLEGALAHIEVAPDVFRVLLPA